MDPARAPVSARVSWRAGRYAAAPRLALTKEHLRVVRADEPPERAPADDLDEQFDAIVEKLRREVRGLRTRIDRYARAHSRVGRVSGDEGSQAADRRLKQLQLVVDQMEAGAAYLIGAGIPAVEPSDPDAAQRVLESLEAERERTSRDIHDGPAQVLANAIFEIEYLERVADRTTDQRVIRAELKKMREQLRGSLESVRAMIFDLRPPTLSQLGLANAMRAYCADFEARFGIRVRADLDETETGLLSQQELAIFRVMQEALQNVHKHAHARVVRLEWTREPTRLVLRVTDDGVGFDLVKATQRKRSVGLLSMRERAELIGGSLQVQAVPEGGTAVTLELPIRPGTP